MYNNEAFSDYQIIAQTGQVLYLHKVILMNKIEAFKVQFTSNIGNKDEIYKKEVESLVPYQLMFEAIYKDQDLNLPAKMRLADLKELMHMLKMYFCHALMVDVYIDLNEAKCEIEEEDADLYEFLYTWEDTVDYKKAYDAPDDDDTNITFKNVLDQIGKEIKADPEIVGKKLLQVIPSDIISPEIYFRKCVEFGQVELIKKIDIHEISREILALVYTDYEISLIKDPWTKVDSASPLSLLKIMDKEHSEISATEWSIVPWINIKVNNKIVKQGQIYLIREIKNNKNESCTKGYKHNKYTIKVEQTGEKCENKTLWASLYKYLTIKAR